MSTHKAIERICQIYKDNPSELNDLLREIVKNKGLSRRRRRAAYEKLREMNDFIELDSDESVTRSCCDYLTDDSDNSSVSSASSGSSENSFDKEQTLTRMGLFKYSSENEFYSYERRIKNAKKVAKTENKKEARRHSIAAKKASRKALEDKKLHDAIQNALRNPVKKFSFLLKQVGFRYVFFIEEKQHALAWINSNYQYEIVLFKGVSSPRKKVICEEIGQRAWQYLRSGKFHLVKPEISKFLEKRNQVLQVQDETNTSNLVLSLFSSDF
jgi:hypothetical protein